MHELKKLIAEFAGTFGLVLIGTGAIIVNEVTSGSVTHLGISIAFGGVVTWMILALGHISGAHINPAVTLGFWLVRHIRSRAVIGYLLVQFLGAIVASIMLRLLFPTSQTMGETLPIAGIWRSAAIEFLMTYILMLVILIFSQSDSLKKYTAWAVGATVGLEAFFGGPYTGASMNPARSLGPALISGNGEAIWIYLLITSVAAVIAAWTWTKLRKGLDS